MSSLLTANNEVFKHFALCASVVTLKTVAMSFVTTYYRRTRRVIISDGDEVFFKGDKPVLRQHPDVDRSLRCHLNDLENVVPFVLAGIFYVASDPDVTSAIWHFRVFTVSRLLHTVVYLGQVRQPARALCFMVGALVNVSMATQAILAFY